MRQTFLAGVVLSLAAAGPVHATQPSYSYFDAAYLKTQRGGPFNDSSGLRVVLSTSLTRSVYFTAGYDHLKRDNSDTKTGLSSAGFGLHSLKSTFQFFGAATYEREDIRPGSGRSSDDEGYGLLLGGRVPVGQVELQADWKYFNYGCLVNGDRDDEDRYRFSALTYLTPQFALTASYEMFEQSVDTDQWTAGLRIYFDNPKDKPRRRRARAVEPVAEPASDSVEPETEAQ